MPSIYDLATYMSELSSGRNTRGGRGFVKKSAMLFALSTNGTVISCALTFSRTKEWRRSIWLVH
eukprot:6190627-Pleurochrysis_carterae.AAC.2